jgi:hypothetical protein
MEQEQRLLMFIFSDQLFLFRRGGRWWHHRVGTKTPPFSKTNIIFYNPFLSSFQKSI